MGFLNRILDRPAHEKPYLLIPVGYPAEGAQVPVIEKRPLEEVLVRITGQDLSDERVSLLAGNQLPRPVCPRRQGSSIGVRRAGSSRMASSFTAQKTRSRWEAETFSTIPLFCSFSIARSAVV